MYDGLVKINLIIFVFFYKTSFKIAKLLKTILKNITKIFLALIDRARLR